MSETTQKQREEIAKANTDKMVIKYREKLYSLYKMLERDLMEDLYETPEIWSLGHFQMEVDDVLSNLGIETEAEQIETDYKEFKGERK